MRKVPEVSTPKPVRDGERGHQSSNVVRLIPRKAGDEFSGRHDRIEKMLKAAELAKAIDGAA